MQHNGFDAIAHDVVDHKGGKRRWPPPRECARLPDGEAPGPV